MATKKQKEMMRNNDGKPNMSFILDFPITMNDVSKVMEMGAQKYERNNWKKGGKMSDCMDSLLRHLTAFHNCQDLDEESQISHMAHVICNAAFIIENYERYDEEFDNRDWENEGE